MTPETADTVGMPPAPVEPGPDADDPRRRSSRHQASELRCDLGDVIDLSTFGMRIRCKGKPPVQVGEAGTVEITAEDGAVKIPFETVWVRRTGFRKHEIGLKFVKIGARVAEILESLARYGFIDTGTRRAA